MSVLNVEEVLASHSSKYKSVQVPQKVIPVTLDLPNLTLIDINPIESTTELITLTRDNVQLLVNGIFDLPTKNLDSGIYAVLPEAKTSIIPIPREKSIPKPKAKTTWQKFAEERGIKKTKNTVAKFDEASETYLPSHGYGSAKNNPMNDWIREVPDNEDPYADQFEKETKKGNRTKKSRRNK